MVSAAIVTIAKTDTLYPGALREIHNPPERLFLRGNLPEGPYLAVVGSRMPSLYGKNMTPKLIEPLVAAGFVIVSGLAYGIDALAHEATLAVSGRTIAVLGTGVDEQTLYPQAHRKLAQRIVAQGGAVISEYENGTQGHPGNFPARNRIIAGLSKGVLVIEAKEKSGALITANLAVRENRDVFALPGPANSATSHGTNRLIQQGAKLVMGAEDILEEYDITLPPAPTAQPFIAESEQRLLRALEHDAVHIDTLTDALKRSAQEITASLTRLELRGLIRNLGGGRYTRV